MEIRKTEIFVEWFDNLRDSRARTRIIARLDRMKRATLVMCDRLVAELMSYVSIMVQATDSILSGAALPLSYFFVAATRKRNMQTSQKRKY